MNTELLETFLSIVDHGGVVKASVQLSMTATQVNSQVRQLENRIGGALFIEHQGSGLLTLTEQGSQLVYYARRILELQGTALQTIKAPRKGCVLNLGCPNGYANNLLVMLINTMEELLPNIRFRLTVGTSAELHALVAKSELDLALINNSDASVQEGMILCHDKGVWAAKKGFEWWTISPLSLLIYNTDCPFYTNALDEIHKKGQEYNLYCVSENLTFIEQLLIEEKGIAPLTFVSMCDGLEVIESELLPPLPSFDISLIHSSSAPEWLTETWLEDVVKQVSEKMARNTSRSSVYVNQ